MVGKTHGSMTLKNIYSLNWKNKRNMIAEKARNQRKEEKEKR
jgi:hypothetical protein